MRMRTVGIAAALVVSAAGAAAAAQPVELRVTVENLAPASGAALSPFTVGFHDGTFDAFDAGSPANPGVRLIAELGDGTQYLADFLADQPQGVGGTIIATMNAFGPGIFLPGGSGSMVFGIDPAANRYFSFGSMVVPSNDRFVGNDSPTAVELFDAGGNFVGQTLTLVGGNIWDAGTEVDGHFGAAFIAGQDAMDHIDENSVVVLNSDFAVYEGASTPAGYDFTALPTDAGELVRISFTVIPAPGGAALIGLGAAAGGLRRRRPL